MTGIICLAIAICVITGLGMFFVGQVKMRKKILDAIKQQKYVRGDIDYESLGFDIDTHNEYFSPIFMMVLFGALVGTILWAVSDDYSRRHTTEVIDNYKKGKYEMVNSYEEVYNDNDSLIGKTLIHHTYNKSGN